MHTKKEPLRMCTGCGEMKPKAQLIRIVRSKDGEISLDATGKKSGRGAYVCKSVECFEKMRKSRRLEKAFSEKIPDEIFVKMEKELEAE